QCVLMRLIVAFRALLSTPSATLCPYTTLFRSRQLLQCQARLLALLIGGIGLGQLTLESCAALCIAFNDDATLLVACELGLLSHVRSALLSEIDVLADDGIVLLEHDAVRAVGAVLAGHVAVPGAGVRFVLGGVRNILGRGHH